jgi:hypothetical protein
MTKKSLIILFLSLLLLLQNNGLFAAQNPLLKFIPADSFFFTGSTQLIPIEEYPLWAMGRFINRSLSQNELNHLGKEWSFFYALFQDFQAVIKKNPAVIQTHYGLDEKMASVFYALGATPVLKFTIKNEKAFLEVLNKAEKKSGFFHQTERFNNRDYRIYSLNNDWQLLVSTGTLIEADKHVTITLIKTQSEASEQQKKLIFAQLLPEHSLADSGKVHSIQKKHQYLPLSVTYLDFVVLAESLLQTKNNIWFGIPGINEQIITNTVSAGCDTDILSLLREIPRLTAGYKQYQNQQQRMSIDFNVSLELKNQRFSSELKSLRGFIPDHIQKSSQNNTIGFALGVDLSQLNPLFLYLSEAFKKMIFHCEPFKEIQRKADQYNPAMLVLMTGLVDGIHGLSFTLQDFNFDEKLMLSLLVTLTAEEPLYIWKMLSALIPDLSSQANVIIPSDKPQKLTLKTLDAMGMELFVALRGSHLVLFSDTKSERLSQRLSNEKIIKNGFLQASLSYEKLASAMENLRDYVVSESLLSIQKKNLMPVEACLYLDESIEFLSKFSGFIDLRSDFVDLGWLNKIKTNAETPVMAELNYSLAGLYTTYALQEGCLLSKDGVEDIKQDSSGFYQKYSDDDLCFIFETRYQWTENIDRLQLHYQRERHRPDGDCNNPFDEWAVPEVEYIHDTCQLRMENGGNFSCLFEWDSVLNKYFYKRL